MLKRFFGKNHHGRGNEQKSKRNFQNLKHRTEFSDHHHERKNEGKRKGGEGRS
jgi:hypothetical protein